MTEGVGGAMGAFHSRTSKETRTPNLQQQGTRLCHCHRSSGGNSTQPQPSSELGTENPAMPFPDCELRELCDSDLRCVKPLSVVTRCTVTVVKEESHRLPVRPGAIREPQILCSDFVTQAV